MILHNVTVVGTNNTVNIGITDGKIDAVSTSQAAINFTDAIVFPGLINSHDHLDFNLFPQLGNRIYPSYTAWGKYLHANYGDEIKAILKIPIVLREKWGVYKNLLCGVTTVVNHGEKLKLKKKLINVLENDQSLHSVQFEKKWKYKLNNPFHLGKKVVIHVGEGTDDAANAEVDDLIKWNLLKRELIGIHGVAVNTEQAKSFKAIVWCPQSNRFLLDAVAAIKQLKQHTKILFGTDSTLTSEWNIWEHIRMARATKMLTDIELYESLTSVAGKIWKNRTGELISGNDADLVVAKKKGNPDSLTAFFAINPQDILLIMQKGKILFFDESLLNQLENIDLKNFCKIQMNGSFKYVVGQLDELMKQIKTYQPDAAFPKELSI